MASSESNFFCFFSRRVLREVCSSSSSRMSFISPCVQDNICMKLSTVQYCKTWALAQQSCFEFLQYKFCLLKEPRYYELLLLYQ